MGLRSCFDQREQAILINELHAFISCLHISMVLTGWNPFADLTLQITTRPR